jgi:hypothetical protein
MKIKTLAFVLSLFVSTFAFTQDISYKKGKILVDGQEYMKLDVKK